MFIEFSDLNEVMHELNGSFRDKSVELELAVRKKIAAAFKRIMSISTKIFHF